MIGRNRCDDPGLEDTVYLVGSDRISTELHNVNEDANASLPKPMTLNYEMNDPADPESIYTRSDHYSYASKGIPIIFYTTGLHKDYHYVTDEVAKIDFPKLARHHAAGLCDRDAGRQPRSRPRARQQGTAEGKGAEGEDRLIRDSGSGFGIRDSGLGTRELGTPGPAAPKLGRLGAKAGSTGTGTWRARVRSSSVEPAEFRNNPNRPNPELRVLLPDELTAHGAAGIDRRVRVEVEARGIAHDRLRVHLAHAMLVKFSEPRSVGQSHRRGGGQASVDERRPVDARGARMDVGERSLLCLRESRESWTEKFIVPAPVIAPEASAWSVSVIVAVPRPLASAFVTGGTSLAALSGAVKTIGPVVGVVGESLPQAATADRMASRAILFM